GCLPCCQASWSRRAHRRASRRASPAKHPPTIIRPLYHPPVCNRHLPESVTDDATRSLPYWEAANEVLSWPEQPRLVVQPGQIVARLRALVRKTGARIAEGGSESQPLSGVEDVAAGVRPEEVFTSPGAFA